jgi:hypothetical protein
MTAGAADRPARGPRGLARRGLAELPTDLLNS